MGSWCTHYKLCSVESKLVCFSQFWAMRHYLEPVCDIWPSCLCEKWSDKHGNWFTSLPKVSRFNFAHREHLRSTGYTKSSDWREVCNSCMFSLKMNIFTLGEIFFFKTLCVNHNAESYEPKHTNASLDCHLGESSTKLPGVISHK